MKVLLLLIPLGSVTKDFIVLLVHPMLGPITSRAPLVLLALVMGLNLFLVLKGHTITRHMLQSVLSAHLVSTACKVYSLVDVCLDFIVQVALDLTSCLALLVPIAISLACH